MKKLIYFFLFIQIFTNAFAISSVLTPAFAVSILLFIIAFFNGDVFKRTNEPFYLVSFYTILFFSYIVMSTGEKSFNHLLMWSVPPFIYYYTFKRQLCRHFAYKELENKLLMVITLAVLVASSFAVFEFAAVNFLGIDLSFIPRGTVEDYTPMGIESIRARSFMEESGQFSFFLEAFVPLSIYWSSRNIKFIILKWCFYAIIAFSLFVSFSAAGFALFLISCFIYFIYRVKSSGNLKQFLAVIMNLLVVLGLVLIIFPEVGESIGYIISSKLDSDNSSYSDRESRLVALKYFIGLPMFIGYGPAAFSTLHVNTFVSFYLGVLMNTGVLGASFLILFLLKQYKYAFCLRDKSLMIAFVTSLTMVFLHLAFVDNIYTPWLWVLLSLLYFAKSKQFLR